MKVITGELRQLWIFKGGDQVPKAVVFGLTYHQDFFSVTSTTEVRGDRGFLCCFFVKTEVEPIVSVHRGKRGRTHTHTEREHGRHKERRASREGRKADRTETERGEDNNPTESIPL